MKRTSVVGFCIVAALALAAFGASVAQAGTMGHCVKASKVGGKYTGKYTNKTCTTAATEAEKTEGKKNKYEFEAVKAGTKFTGAGGKSTLKGAAGEITCESSETTGEQVGGTGKEGRDKFQFFGCKLSVTSGACESAGAKEGEIVSNELTSHLIDNGEKGDGGKEPAVGEVWIEEEATAPDIYLAEFTCAPGLSLKVTGSASGKMGPVNTVTKAGKPGKKPKYTFTTVFSETVGEQNLRTSVYIPELEETKEGPSIQTGEGGSFYTEKGLEILT